MCCIVLQCGVTLRLSALQCVAACVGVCYRDLQCVAVMDALCVMEDVCALECVVETSACSTNRAGHLRLSLFASHLAILFASACARYL